MTPFCILHFIKICLFCVPVFSRLCGCTHSRSCTPRTARMCIARERSMQTAEWMLGFWRNRTKTNKNNACLGWKMYNRAVAVVWHEICQSNKWAHNVNARTLTFWTDKVSVVFELKKPSTTESIGTKSHSCFNSPGRRAIYKDTLLYHVLLSSCVMLTFELLICTLFKCNEQQQQQQRQ